MPWADTDRDVCIHRYLFNRCYSAKKVYSVGCDALLPLWAKRRRKKNSSQNNIHRQKQQQKQKQENYELTLFVSIDAYVANDWRDWQANFLLHWQCHKVWNFIWFSGSTAHSIYLSWFLLRNKSAALKVNHLKSSSADWIKRTREAWNIWDFAVCRNAKWKN